MKPIVDKAEVAIDFPDKVYYGTFSRSSGFDVACDAEGASVKLMHAGSDGRTAEIHLHYYLLADILAALADSIADKPPIDDAHRSELLDAVRRLDGALSKTLKK
jgi:hypothetical protein